MAKTPIYLYPKSDGGFMITQSSEFPPPLGARTWDYPPRWRSSPARELFQFQEFIEAREADARAASRELSLSAQKLGMDT